MNAEVDPKRSTMHWLTRRIGRLGHRLQPASNLGPQLRALRPSFEQDTHGVYVELLVAQLAKKDPPRNIALSGPYGSGKSSVLLGLRSANRAAVEVALGTVDDNTSAILGSTRRWGESSSTTEALQKEIVKRLLYSAKASSLPRSRLNRIRPFQRSRAFLISAVVALAFAFVAWVYNFPAPFTYWFSVSPYAQSVDSAWSLLALFGDTTLAFGLTLAFQWIASIIQFRELKLGEFSLAREDPAQNYFDQYLDEIVYFFAATKTRVVIFEDLDRFKDRGIFIALRELNVLLNNSDAVRKPVTFIYAIGDKVFAPTTRSGGAEGTAAAGSMRAKFFDLIVPIVPFVSTETSGGLLAIELRGLPESSMPDSDLVRLTGPHFPDMRVIKSIRNEYEMYYDRLVRGGSLQLDANRLFASVLYKHAFPEDHERIQYGSSNLDKVLVALELAKKQRLRGLDAEIASRRDAIARHTRLTARASEAANRLRAVLALFAPGGRRRGVVTVTVGGLGTPDADLDKLEFWRHLEATPTEDLIVEFPPATNRTVDRAALTAVLPVDLPPEWLHEEDGADETQLNRLGELRRALAHANISELLTEPSFAGIAVVGRGEEEKREDLDFSSIAIRIVGSGLTMELLEKGYLDETFALYASEYQDALVSAAAQNFRIQYLARRRSAPTYPLSSVEIQELRARAGDSFLDEPSSLNVSIFDELIDTGHLDNAVSLIARGRLDESHEFLDTYLRDGRSTGTLLHRLVPQAPWVLRFIASREAPVTESQSLFNVAASSLGAEVDYEIDGATEKLLQAFVYASLKPHGVQLTKTSASPLARIISERGLRVPDLSRLSAPGRAAIAAAGAFEINRENIASLARNKGSLGLDSIGRNQPVVLQHVLSRLPEYLDVIDMAGRPSLDRPGSIDQIVPVIATFGPRELREVVLRAQPDMAMSDLALLNVVDKQIALAALQVLAGENFFTPSVRNVHFYVEFVGADEYLASFIRRNHSLRDADELSQEGRTAVARAVIELPGIPTSSLSTVLRSLELGQLDPRGLNFSSPEAAATLMREGLLPDSPSTHSAIAKSPWAVRESALLASPSVRDYLPQLTFSDDDLEHLLGSASVDDDLKLAILTEPSQFDFISTPASATFAIALAIRTEYELTPSELEALLRRGADPSLAMRFLGARVDSFSDDDLRVALAAMPVGWRSLIDGSSQWTIYDVVPGLERVLDRLKAMGIVSKVSHLVRDRVRVTFSRQ